MGGLQGHLPSVYKYIGNVKTAIKLITEDENSGSLPLNSLQLDMRSVKNTCSKKIHPGKQLEIEAASISLCVSLSIRELVANCSGSSELHSPEKTILLVCVKTHWSLVFSVCKHNKHHV